MQARLLVDAVRPVLSPKPQVVVMYAVVALIAPLLLLTMLWDSLPMLSMHFSWSTLKGGWLLPPADLLPFS